MHHFTEQQLIGKGGYGEVYKYTQGGKTIACKKVDLTKKDSFINEVKMAIKTKNLKGVVAINKAFTQGSHGYMFMELCKIDLCDYVLTKIMLSEQEAAQLFYSICTAVQELHQHGIAHLDLKLDNILLTFDEEVKLIDFGSAVEFTRGTKMTIDRKVGTRCYVAPELTSKYPVCISPEKADIWSLGIILNVLLTGCFPDAISTSILSSIKRQTSPKSIKNLLAKMLNPNPNERIGLKEVLSHPWLIRNLNKSQ